MLFCLLCCCCIVICENNMKSAWPHARFLCPASCFFICSILLYLGLAGHPQGHPRNVSARKSAHFHAIESPVLISYFSIPKVWNLGSTSVIPTHVFYKRMGCFHFRTCRDLQVHYGCEPNTFREMGCRYHWPVSQHIRISLHDMIQLQTIQFPQ